MNAVYSARFNETLRLQQLLTKDRIGEDADVSTISHNQDFEDNEPTRAVYTVVKFETETPPMHIPHTLWEADGDIWLHNHLRKYPQYQRQLDGSHFWSPDAAQ